MTSTDTNGGDQGATEDPTAPGRLDRPTNVVEAIARVMAEMPGVGKNQKMDSTAGKYNYRGIEDVTAAIQKLMGRYGIVPAPKIKSRSVKDLTINGKPWTEDTMEVYYVLRGPAWAPDDKRDKITVGPFHGIARDMADKGTNKAMTMTLKQMLLQVFVIGDGSHDPDSYASESRDRDREPSPDELAERAGWRSEEDHQEQVAAARDDMKDRIKAGKLTSDQANAAWKHYQRPDGLDFNPRPRTKAEHDAWRSEYLMDSLDPDEPFALPHERAAVAPPAPPQPPSPQPSAPAAATAEPGPARGPRDGFNDILARDGFDALLAQVKAATVSSVVHALAERGLNAVGEPDQLRADLVGAVVKEGKADKEAEAGEAAEFFAQARTSTEAAQPELLGAEQQAILDAELARQEQAKSARRAAHGKG